MATATAEKATGLALLREPFPANQISKLPKPFKKDAEKGNCRECGGYHGLPAMHLDYVGHAALTDRLLDADPNWTWEPVADPKSVGLPVADGGMWIRLTVCGVTRLGFGFPDGKVGGNAVKEVIGDALRNAAMRFGAALDLWHKGQLHEDEDDTDQSRPSNGNGKPATGFVELPPERNKVPGPAPEGYEAFVAVLDGTAADGLPALMQAFNGAKLDFRNHLTRRDNATWEAMKAKAQKAVKAS